MLRIALILSASLAVVASPALAKPKAKATAAPAKTYSISYACSADQQNCTLRLIATGTLTDITNSIRSLQQPAPQKVVYCPADTRPQPSHGVYEGTADGKTGNMLPAGPAEAGVTTALSSCP